MTTGATKELGGRQVSAEEAVALVLEEAVELGLVPPGQELRSRAASFAEATTGCRPRRPPASTR